MDYTVVLSCCVVCLSVLAGLLIVSLVFYKITEKKQEEMICLLLLEFTLRSGEPGATGRQHLEFKS